MDTSGYRSLHHHSHLLNFCRTLSSIVRNKLLPIEFFTVYTKLAEMALLYSKNLATAKKKLLLVELGLMLEIITGLGVQCLTI